MAGRTCPVLLFDGDCAFCTSCARVIRRIGPDAEILAWQLADLAELGVTEEQAAAAVQWVGVDGRAHSGHEAIAAMLISAGRVWAIAGRVLLLPGISLLAAKAYGLVASNRQRLPGGTPACDARSRVEGRRLPSRRSRWASGWGAARHRGRR
jgi:predicted DCC family thiol-disulfide oxidoreductase YuxK